MDFFSQMVDLNIQPKVVEVSQQTLTDQPLPPEKPQLVRIVEAPLPLMKGDPVLVCKANTLNGTYPDNPIPMHNWNALYLEVRITGGGSVDITVEGSQDNTVFTTLPDGSATMTTQSANVIKNIAVGCGWIRVRLASISSATVTIIATPFISPGYR